MPRKTVPQRAKAPASAAQPAGNKGKKIDSGIFKVDWLQVPTDAVLKVDLGALMLVPAADDQGFTAGKGMLFAPDTYVSRQKYEFLKDAGSVKVGAGYGLQLHGDEETDYFCEGLLDNDGCDIGKQSGRYLLAMPFPLRKRTGYGTEVDRRYVHAGQVCKVTDKPLDQSSGSHASNHNHPPTHHHAIAVAFAVANVVAMSVWCPPRAPRALARCALLGTCSGLATWRWSRGQTRPVQMRCAALRSPPPQAASRMRARPLPLPRMQ